MCYQPGIQKHLFIRFTMAHKMTNVFSLSHITLGDTSFIQNEGRYISNWLTETDTDRIPVWHSRSWSPLYACSSSPPWCWPPPIRWVTPLSRPSPRAPTSSPSTTTASRGRRWRRDTRCCRPSCPRREDPLLMGSLFHSAIKFLWQKIKKPFKLRIIGFLAQLQTSGL